MSTDEQTRQRRERLGGALECECDTKVQLGKLEERARTMASRLEALTQVVAGKRRGRVNADPTQGRFLVYPDGMAEPVPVPYPSEQEIVDLLTEREQLQANLEQAAEILAPYQKR